MTFLLEIKMEESIFSRINCLFRNLTIEYIKERLCKLLYKRKHDDDASDNDDTKKHKRKHDDDAMDDNDVAMDDIDDEMVEETVEFSVKRQKNSRPIHFNGMSRK
jgi:hypothetical protein